MRTPGQDEDLVRGFLFNEQIIENLDEIENIENIGNRVGQYEIHNKILVTLNNSKNVNISKTDVLLYPILGWHRFMI